MKKESGNRLLVVDDNEITAKTTGWLLELRLGYEVQMAYDGISAIALAKSFVPNVILLDIGLPKMNGYDVCRAMRKEPLLKNTIIIAQTGWGLEEHRNQSKEAGFDYHFVKPTPIDELIVVLEMLTLKKNHRSSA